MRAFFLTTLMIIFSNLSFGQSSAEPKGHHGIYAELTNIPFFIIPVPKGGSIGYEYHFGSDFPSSNIRVGFEYKKLDGNYYNLTGAYNFLIGKNKNRFEMGLSFHFGKYENTSHEYDFGIPQMIINTFELETIFSRVGVNTNYVRVLSEDAKVLLRIGINFLSKDLHLKVIKNDYINSPGDGDQWIQPHINFSVSKMF